MSTNVAISRNVTISSTTIEGSGFDSTLAVFEENQKPLYFACDRSQGDLLFQIREMLFTNENLANLINKATQLFRNRGNEGIFYNIIEEEIADIELNGHLFLDKHEIAGIVKQNERFLSWVEDRIKKTIIYDQTNSENFYSSGITTVKEVCVNDNGKKGNKRDKEIASLQSLFIDGEEGALMYKKVIAFLKQDFDYKDTRRPFITEVINEGSAVLRWDKTISGSIKYLAGLMYTLHENGWILLPGSAPVLRAILCKTFNITFDHGVLKSIAVTHPGKEYLAPFDWIEANK